MKTFGITNMEACWVVIMDLRSSCVESGVFSLCKSDNVLVLSEQQHNQCFIMLSAELS